ncbi:MAG: RNA polymerase factor sigma-32 [Alphaproteobacteria bacterium]|nr:RNA polymerase factor sigma-32 [Alphaproteobacteria bacterium]MCL2889715.1 RNA polymerase factor sigma-32 [Alphaproteobacteria bacterium]
MKGRKSKITETPPRDAAVPAVIQSPRLPVISDESSLDRYVRAIQQFPLLSPEDEYKYATEFQQTKDAFAAEKLVTSHLRMVVSVAYDFRNYGIPVVDLIASGNLGLMQALQKFDPERGFRFSTYAMFWIKAEIYETILNNWSMVKIGTSANQKRVFFGLSRAKRALGIMDSTLSSDQTKQIAEYLDVSESDVENMSGRMRARDLSLNRPAHDEDGGADIMSNLADNADSPEDKISDMQFRRFGHELLQKHMADLPERDRAILIARRLSDPVQTLEQLAEKYSVSRERIRQIEERAFSKLQSAMLSDANKE